ncbi:MAG: hypothetical protein CVV64_04560 [Candidatus Wallbacteria bacterium HGW-Wallbacteria-1]|jgi:CBS domain containing-hemolysin-like protein|uniref:HlyC/CorC family transporter n=1 Tax=Candidatus Wallbacteria bacterium HGW-Wallbacteria-1 TaxID=2013854 RepID=A0A2N1PRT8_9BACT|nr:MAG: hypothetical protein CVV64_04560 [Candidatus Wallbacteria bacterium HGW-Wallbacteria-1]
MLIFKCFLVLFFLLLAGFYAGAETAFISINRMRLKYLVDNGNSRAMLVARILDRPREFISTVLVGTNLFVVSASALATSIGITFLVDGRGFGRSEVTGITTLIMTVLTLLFSQILPKSIFRHHADSYTLAIAPAIQISKFLFLPVIFLIKIVISPFFWLLGWNTDVFRGFDNDERIKSRKDLELIFQMSHEEGVLETDEHDMIRSVFNISDTLSREIMTPRVDMVAVRDDIEVEDMIQVFETTGYSRIPVYSGNIDNIVGIVHVMDLICAAVIARDVKTLMRKPFFIPETKHIGVLLAEFKKEKTHMSIVVDEYGGVAGLVTVEDILEQIVGDIDDEYDIDEVSEIIRSKDDENLAILDGTARIDDVNEEFDLDLPENEDFDSIGGLIFFLIGDIPEIGAEVSTPDGKVKFTVEDADSHRVYRVRMEITSESDTVTDEDQSASVNGSRNSDSGNSDSNVRENGDAI